MQYTLKYTIIVHFKMILYARFFFSPFVFANMLKGWLAFRCRKNRGIIMLFFSLQRQNTNPKIGSVQMLSQPEGRLVLEWTQMI